MVIKTGRPRAVFPPFPRDSKEEQPGRGSTASQLQGGQGTAAIAGNACTGWVTWQEDVRGWPSDRA